MSVRLATNGILFHSQPQTLETGNVQEYLRQLATNDRPAERAVVYRGFAAEISARGEVTTCHTFNDLPLGSIYDARYWKYGKANGTKRILQALSAGASCSPFAQRAVATGVVRGTPIGANAMTDVLAVAVAGHQARWDAMRARQFVSNELHHHATCTTRWAAARVPLPTESVAG